MTVLTNFNTATKKKPSAAAGLSAYADIAAVQNI